MNEYIPVLIALVAGPVAAIVAGRVSRPKIKADTAKTYNDIAISLLDKQEARIVSLEAAAIKSEQHSAEQDRKIEHLEIKNRDVTLWAKALSGQVIEAGHTPITLAEIEGRA